VNTFGYDVLGNLKSIGLSAVSTINLAYNASGAASLRPHAVANESRTGQPSFAYSYDANGNLLNDGRRTFTYTSSNLPLQITRGAATINFAYDGENRRVWKTGPSGTLFYVGSREDTGVRYEKNLSTAGTATHHHYLYAGSRLVGVVVRDNSGGSYTRYFHTDRLGSITAITNELGQIVERLSYGPWGKRRFANGTTDTAGTLIGQTTRLGFSGAEHLDEVGLVHLNGRLYNPDIGRFTSADRFVPNWTNSQSYNRYSYVRNNPLKYVDPSGFWDEDPDFIDIDPSSLDLSSGVDSSQLGGSSSGGDITIQSSDSWNSGGSSSFTVSQCSGSCGMVSNQSLSQTTTGIGFSGGSPDLQTTPVGTVNPALLGLMRGRGEGPEQDEDPAPDQSDDRIVLAAGIGGACSRVNPIGCQTLDGIGGPGVGGPSSSGRAGSGPTGGTNFYRGATPGEAPSFVPRTNEFKIDPNTGFVKDTHGISVFDNPLSVSAAGRIPYRVDQSSIPDSLRIIQRGGDPHHFEIVPMAGANLTPQQFINACTSIVCAR
jgi:RHS repeat-associated protein